MVIVKLNLTLIDQLGDDEIRIEIKESSTFDSIIDIIGLEKESVGMVIKNGRWAPLECTVEPNDKLELFPHLEGG
jgi:sulfur carrier protein ThiS